MKAEGLLYFSRFFGSFGQWLTFLGIALFVQEKFGAYHVPWTFLIQTLPAFLLSNFLCEKFSRMEIRKTLFVSYCLLAMGILFLSLYPSLTNIYLYLIFGSLVGALSMPLLNHAVSEWFAKQHYARVHTKLGSIQASTLIFAPIAGGFLTAQFGYKILFIITSLCYAFSALFLILMKSPAKTLFAREQDRTVHNIFLQIRYIRNNLSLRFNVILWCLLMLTGSLLNSIEFSIFKKHNLSSETIGLMMACWGIGSMGAFALSSFKKIQMMSIIPISSFFLTLSLASFVFAQSPFLIASSFIVAGFFNAQLSGQIRAYIQKVLTQNQSLGIWGFLHRVTSLITMIVYVSMGFLLKQPNTVVLGSIILLIVSLLLLLVGTKFKTLPSADVYEDKPLDSSLPSQPLPQKS